MGAPTLEIASEVSGWHAFTEEQQADTKLTILLVEDEDFVRRVACQILRDAGYQVITAKNAGEAVLACEEHGGDVRLLLSDVVLPGESGRSLAQKIRQIDSSIEVLLMTGYAEQMDADWAEHEDLLAKPFASAELLRRVAQLLERETVARQIQSEESETRQIRLA